MAITPVDDDQVLNSTATTSYVVPRPTSGGALLENDFLVVDYVANTSSTDAVTPPAGWTVGVASGVTGAVGFGMWYHKVTAAEAASPPASWTFTIGTARAGNMIIRRFRAQDLNTPIDVAISTATSATSSTTVTGVTTVTNNCLLIGCGNLQSASTQSISVPSGWTQQRSTCTLGAGRGQNTGYLQLGAAGATGNQTWTKTSALAGHSYILALRPAANQSITVNQVTETGTANAIAVQQGTLVNQVTETGTANSILAQQGTPLGQVTETGTVNAIVPQIGAPVAKVTETGTVNSITPVSGTTVDIGQVVEIGTANTITATQPGLFIAVGQVAETGTVNLITPSYAAGSKRDRLLAALRAQGFTGTVSDMEYARLKTATGNDGVGETMRDMVIQNNETNRLW